MYLGRIAAVVGALAISGLALGQARAEIITLSDGSRIFGKVVHYYDGTLTIKASGDVVLKLPVSRVKSIKFKLPKPRRAFSSPAKTFRKQHKALLSGRIPEFIDCYSLQYQTLLMHQMGSMGLKDLQEMRRAVKGTRYKLKRPKYKGKMATMEVIQTRGNMSAKVLLQFVKENGEWKMIPMQGQLPAAKPPPKGSRSR